MNEPSKQRTYWRYQLLCDVYYSTMEKLSGELHIYCYVINVTEQRYFQPAWKQMEISVTQASNGFIQQNKSYGETE